MTEPARWPFIWDATCGAPHATNPDSGLEKGSKPRVCQGRSPGTAENELPAVPIRSCSRWGLPCRYRYRQRGALLPHPFTLASHPRRRTGRPRRHPKAQPRARDVRRDRRFAFCCTFPGVAPAGRYPAPFLHGARTFLHRQGRPEGRPSRQRPSSQLAGGEVRAVRGRRVKGNGGSRK